MQGKNRANRPAPHNGIRYLVQVIPHSLTVPDRQLIHRIGCQDLSRIVKARRPFGPWVVDVLPVGRNGCGLPAPRSVVTAVVRSEEHTSELQSRGHLVCRLLLEKKKQLTPYTQPAHYRPQVAASLTSSL